MDGHTPGAARAEWRAHWPLVLAATAGMSLASVSVYSLGVLMQPIQQELGWSRAQISSGPAIVSFVAVCLSTIVGVGIDRVGARAIGLISTVLLCGALAGMSLATADPRLWWLLWGLVGLAGAAMPTVWTLPVSGAFDRARGLAIAVTLSGTGIGASLVPLVAGYVVEHHGWRQAYLALGAVWAVLVLPLVFLFFHQRGHAPRTGRPAAPAADLPGVPAREGFRSPVFWKLALAAFGTSLAGTALVLNLVPILAAGGIGRATAIGIAGVTGFATIGGRIAGGWLMDRIDARWVAFGGSIAALAFPAAMLAVPGSAGWALVGVVVFGVSSAPKMGAIIYLVSRHFGPRSFGTLFGTIHAMLALGVGGGPLLASMVFDARGSYALVLWAAIGILLLVALLFLTIGPPPPPAEAARDGL